MLVRDVQTKLGEICDICKKLTHLFFTSTNVHLIWSDHPDLTISGFYHYIMGPVNFNGDFMLCFYEHEVQQKWCAPTINIFYEAFLMNACIILYKIR